MLFMLHLSPVFMGTLRKVHTLSPSQEDTTMMLTLDMPCEFSRWKIGAADGCILQHVYRMWRKRLKRHQTGSQECEPKGSKMFVTCDSPHPQLRTAPQSSDQTFDNPMNKSLKVSSETRKPVRVIRGFKLPSIYAPASG